MSDEFLTDANGYDLVTRKVFPQEGKEEYFSQSFYPVDASITMGDLEGERSLTVWNDRPQAGSVHFKHGIRLLIERRVNTKDAGGLEEFIMTYQGDEHL